jgi:hypothetical protein
MQYKTTWTSERPMNSTATWPRATKSMSTPKAPPQRRSPTMELLPMVSLQHIISYYMLFICPHNILYYIISYYTIFHYIMSCHDLHTSPHQVMELLPMVSRPHTSCCLILYYIMLYDIILNYVIQYCNIKPLHTAP